MRHLLVVVVPTILLVTPSASAQKNTSWTPKLSSAFEARIKKEKKRVSSSSVKGLYGTAEGVPYIKIGDTQYRLTPVDVMLESPSADVVATGKRAPKQLKKNRKHYMGEPIKNFVTHHSANDNELLIIFSEL